MKHDDFVREQALATRMGMAWMLMGPVVKNVTSRADGQGFDT
jgi:hypothetical protein